MNLTWYPAGQAVSYLDLRFPGGMLFATSGSASGPVEPSAINLDLPVAEQAEDSRQDLGYYPHYGQLTPRQRRTYLEWLAKERSDAEPGDRGLGYLFLFFYGLERRISLNGDRDAALTEELIRLLQVYGPCHKSRSLRGYFLTLAHYGAWQQGRDAYRSIWPRLIALDDGKTGEEAMKLVLANLFDRQEPMHWSLAYRLAIVDPNSRRSVVVNNARKQFWSLFQQRYEEEFPGGIKLQAARQPAVFHYQPASSALLSYTRAQSQWPFELRVTNILGLHSQFRRVSEIWNSCVEDLSGYSKAVTSKKADATGLKAWLALPAELRIGSPNPMQPFWKWLKEDAPRESRYYFAAIGSIAPWLGMEERVKLTRSQSAELANTLCDMGWNIAPHPSHVDQPYTWTQEVALYRRESDKPVGTQVPGWVRLLYLVMPIASADGTVEQEELAELHQLMSNEISSSTDRRYLDALEAALMRDTNVALKALPSMAKRITHNKEGVLRVLLRIAAADGEIAPEELKVLRRIGRAFELSADIVPRLIAEDIAFREVVVVEAPAKAQKGEVIPPKPQPARSRLALDMERVDALTRETHEVVAMLAAVMTDDVPIEPADQPARGVTPTTEKDAEWMQGLDARFHAVVVELVRLDEVPSEQFAELAARHHLLVDDLFNSVNSWADETLGDFLLERSDPIRIYRNLIPSTVLS